MLSEPSHVIRAIRSFGFIHYTICHCIEIMELSEYHKSKLLNETQETIQQIKKSLAESLKTFKTPDSTPQIQHLQWTRTLT